MPELSTKKTELIKQCIDYLKEWPLIKRTCQTGISYRPPISAGIVLTVKCNLNCKFCFMDKREIANKLDKGEFFRLIDFLAHWGIKQVTFTGGEPLLEKNFCDILEYTKRYDIKIGFSTNGTLLTKETVLDLVRIGVDRISVSIDGPREIHDMLRGKGVYERAIRGIKLLRKYGNKKINLRINTVVLDINLKYLKELFFLAKKLDVKLNLMPFTNFPLTAVHKNVEDDVIKQLWVREENIPYLTKVIEELKILKRHYGVLFNQDHFLDLLKAYYHYQGNTDRRCQYGAYELNFLTNGDAIICPQLGTLGNVRNNTPEEIWKSKKIMLARHKLKKCKGCLLNCTYTPSLSELVKDFIIYPLGRNLNLNNKISVLK